MVLESDAFADREQLRFRLRGRDSAEPMIVEQQACLAERDDLIGWMRVVCSGKRTAGLTRTGITTPWGRRRGWSSRP